MQRSIMSGEQRNSIVPYILTATLAIGFWFLLDYIYAYRHYNLAVENGHLAASLTTSVLHAYGPIRIAEGELYAGDRPLSSANDLVGTVKLETGLDASIYQGEQLIASSLYNDPYLMYTLPVFDESGLVRTVIEAGERQAGIVELAGKKWVAAFDPLLASDYRVVGVVGIFQPVDVAYAGVFKFRLFVGIGLMVLILAGWVALYYVQNALGKMRSHADELGVLNKEIVTANARLRQSENRLMEIIDTTSELIHSLDGSGTVLYVNRSWEERIGYPLNEVKGKSIFEFVPREYLEAFTAHFDHMQSNPGLHTAEFALHDRQGKTVLLRGKELSVRKGDRIETRGMFKDVTEEVASRKKVAETEQKFKKLFDKSSNPILLFDDNGIIDCNEACRQILKSPDRDTLIGKRHAELSPVHQPDGMGSSRKSAIMAEHAKRKGFHRFEWSYQAFDETRVVVEVMLTFLTLDEREVYLMEWFDLSEHKKLEEKLLIDTNRLSIVNQVSKATFSSENLRDTIMSCLFSMVDLAGVSGANISLFHDERGTFTSYGVVSYKKKREYTGKEFPLEIAREFEEVMNGSLRLVQDLEVLQKRTVIEERLLADGVRSYVMCPVKANNKVIGYLNVASVDAGGMHAEIVQLTEEVAQMLALVIHQRALQQDIALRNEVILQKNQDITDSLNYATRIQRALLPYEKGLRDYFPSSFIYLKPKDIVSGDFYWYGETNGKVVVALADCTGHGVPGSFLTILGVTALNQIVKESNCCDPAEILKKVHKTFNTSLSNKGVEATLRDGMDIAIVVFDRSGHEVIAASARRPIYLVRSNKKLVEVKPTKFSIGEASAEPVHFESHRIPIASGDAVFMFSDGIPDQFGGEAGKKFTAKRLREILTEGEDIFPKGGSLIKEIEAWKKNIEQVDDMLLIGIKYEIEEQIQT